MRFEDMIKKDTKIGAALAAVASGGVVSSTGTAANSTTRPPPSRTMASPNWNGEVPVNFKQRLSLTAIGVADFETNNTLLRKNH